jgi:transposase
MAEIILLDASGLLEVKVEDEYYHVIYGIHRFAWFHEKDAAAKRVVVVQLANMGVAKTEIARAFDVQRSSIYVWMKRFEEHGLEGVVSMEKGPESKFTEDVKDYICDLHKRLGNERFYKEKIAREEKKLYGVDVSREGIRRVLNERKENQELVAEAVEVVEVSQACEKPAVVKHGGALLSLALLGKYGIEKLLVQGLKQREGRYSFKECVFSLLLLLGPRLLRVEENLKHYDDELMGG